jgi:hypothetical protein
MKWAIAFIISLHALTSRPAQAAESSQRLTEYCRQQTSRALDPALQDLFSRYPTVESRTKNPQGFVADIDRVIARMPYASVLDCRDRVPYQLSFLPETESRMFVSAKYSRAGDLASVTLNFDLTKPTPGVFFSYLHELQHVCQKYDSQALVKHQYQEYAKLTPLEKLYYSNRENAKKDGRPNPEFQMIYDEVKRLVFLNEIDAFHVQFLRFQQTLKTSSPGLCGSSSLQLYVAMEHDLESGHFAQNIMSSYMNGVEDADPAYFIPASPLADYYDEGTGSHFQMRDLNAAMVSAIAQMGISYSYPGPRVERPR